MEVRNEDVLHRVKEERNILHTIERRNTKWIGHVLRRNCLLKHAIEGQLQGRIEVTWRRGRRRKQLLDNLKEKRRWWKLKEEALDCTLWRTCFGRGKEPVGRHSTEWLNECVVGYWCHARKLYIFCFCIITFCIITAFSLVYMLHYLSKDKQYKCRCH
jgi:hypothetical protein